MTAPLSPLRMTETFTHFDDHWAPKAVAEVNGWHLKLVKSLGEFVWHSHDVDEIFWVRRGELVIRLEGLESACLRAQDVAVVPRGLRHQPIADEECWLVLLEPAGVPNTGDAEGAPPATDQWL